MMKKYWMKSSIRYLNINTSRPATHYIIHSSNGLKKPPEVTRKYFLLFLISRQPCTGGAGQFDLHSAVEHTLPFGIFQWVLFSQSINL